MMWANAKTIGIVIAATAYGAVGGYYIGVLEGKSGWAISLLNAMSIFGLLSWLFLVIIVITSWLPMTENDEMIQADNAERLRWKYGGLGFLSAYLATGGLSSISSLIARLL